MGPPRFRHRLFRRGAHYPNAMSKRTRWLLGLAGVIILTALVARVIRPSEPTYQGRTLSEWLRVYREGPDRREQASMAVRQIGTNAFPFLLDWIAHDRPVSQLRNVVGHLLELVPWRLRPAKWVDWASNEPGPSRPDLAELGLQILGDQARTLLPELTRLARDPASSWGTSVHAIRCMNYIGKAAVPYLSAQLADTNAPYRGNVILLMCGLPTVCSNLDVFLPPLIRCLDDPDPTVRRSTFEGLDFMAHRPGAVIPFLETLGEYGSQARPAIPVLLPLAARWQVDFRDPNLNDFKDRLRSSVPQNPVVEFRWALSQALFKIAPELFTNAPAAPH